MNRSATAEESRVEPRRFAALAAECPATTARVLATRRGVALPAGARPLHPWFAPPAPPRTSCSEERMSNTPIGDHALISDCHSSAGFDVSGSGSLARPGARWSLPS